MLPQLKTANPSNNTQSKYNQKNLDLKNMSQSIDIGFRKLPKDVKMKSKNRLRHSLQAGHYNNEANNHLVTQQDSARSSFYNIEQRRKTDQLLA